MKITSHILSKQLAEAGFEAETNYIYAWSGDDHQLLCFSNPVEIDHEKDILGYDFQTLWDALPKFYAHTVANIPLTLYEDCIGFVSNTWDNDGLEIDKQENESLADCAARLLLKLLEKELITFKK